MDENKYNRNKQAKSYIDILEDQVSDLDKFSVENDDLFDVQVVTLKEIVKDLRKQLL